MAIRTNLSPEELAKGRTLGARTRQMQGRIRLFLQSDPPLISPLEATKLLRLLPQQADDVERRLAKAQSRAVQGRSPGVVRAALSKDLEALRQRIARTGSDLRTVRAGRSTGSLPSPRERKLREELHRLRV